MGPLMPTKAPKLFKVVISDGFDWDCPPLEFDNLGAARGHAEGKIAMLADLGAAPGKVTARVLQGRRTVLRHSVASWRMIKFFGVKKNAPRS